MRGELGGVPMIPRVKFAEVGLQKKGSMLAWRSVARLQGLHREDHCRLRSNSIHGAEWRLLYRRPPRLNTPDRLDPPSRPS